MDSVGLLDVMRRAKNAMSAFTMSLRISTNNGANMATTGYKSLRQSFKTVFNDVMNEGFQGNATGGGQLDPMQFGSGVTLASISLDFSQGALGEGGALDCAVSGRGLFVVSPDGGSTLLYSRSGEFHVDNTGQYIVDSSGRVLIGVNGPITTQGNKDVGWTEGGVLMGDYTNFKAGTSSGVQLGQIKLADFSNVEGLVQFDGTAFKETASSGGAYYGNSGAGTFGSIQPQNLEKSNVFFVGETIDSIEVQRAMSAALTSIKIASDQISQVINKLMG